MTNKEMRDFVELIYDWLGGPGVNGKVTHDVHIGAARQKCEQLLAALEAEPLAVAKGDVWAWPSGPVYLYRLESGEIELTPGLGADAGGKRIPVTVTITERKRE